MLSTLPKADFNISVTFILWSANAMNFDPSKILRFSKELILYHTIPTFYDPKESAFENIVGKEAGNQHHLSFPTMFCILSRTNFAIWITSNLSSVNSPNLDWSKLLL